MGEHAMEFLVGDLRCLALDDGTLAYDAEQFFADVPADAAAAALAEHGLAHDHIPSPYTCLLVETRGQRILVDTGGAGSDPAVGRLRESLREAGVEPDSIDVVVLTHGHADHIGGVVDEHGVPTYGRARHVMDRAEWAFWADAPAVPAVPEAFRRTAERCLPPIEPQLELTDGELEIAPRVRIVPTRGHTPGHLAVVVESAGMELLYISDAALHPLHLEHPDWHPRFDLDPAAAVASRRLLLERAAERRSLVLAYHFDPFPSLGRIRRRDRAWAWEAVAPEELGRSSASGVKDRRGGWRTRASAADGG